jgi:glyoxylase-like metal-dependent hydrolase (beta-lactamase superfamily II)
MSIGETFQVDGCDRIYCVDAGLYDTTEFGAVYVVGADRPAIIDTGIGKHWEKILQGVESAGYDREDVGVIAPTHVHLDHAGGTGYLAEACPNAEVITHQKGVPHLNDPTTLWEGTKKAVGGRTEFYKEPKPVANDRLRGVEGGESVDLGDRQLEVVHAPGHAPHQVVFHEPDAKVAFTADAAGMYVPGVDVVKPTTPPTDFDFEQALADIQQLQALEPDVLCYGHFGPAETANRLQEAETALIDWVDRVDEARTAHEKTDAIIEHVVEAVRRDDHPLLSSGIKIDVIGVLKYLREDSDHN